MLCSINYSPVVLNELGLESETSKMKTNQPEWKFKANLGDRNPIEHGGYFVFTDSTDVYPPEAELLTNHNGDKWEVRRVVLEPCTFIDGVLSDNKFHPKHPAWFADTIGDIANCVGIPLATLVDMLTHGNVESRALAWQAIGDFHGWDNLDSYPLLLSRDEVTERYKDLPI